MQIQDGKKYQNRGMEKSIMDIKIDDTYTLYVFKGVLSENDIRIKYSKLGKRMRTPKHIHWVIDILLKEQKSHEQIICFINYMQTTWKHIKGLKKNDYETIKQVLWEEKKKADKVLKRLTFIGGEYPMDFLFLLLLLLMIQEKTNRPDAYLFNQILEELQKENMDIFRIVNTSTLGRR